MSHRSGDERQTEWTRWVASFPGASHPPDESGVARRVFRSPLAHPFRTMLILLGVISIAVIGSWAAFGAGDPALSVGHDAATGTLEVNGTICCANYQEIAGQDYVFLAMLDRPGFLSSTSHDVTLQIVRIDSDGAPESVASLNAPIESRLPWSMAIIGESLYLPLGEVEADEHGVWIIDVSDPESPVERALHLSDSRYHNLIAGPDGTLIAHSATGFTSYDLSDPGNLTRIGYLERPQADARHITVDDAGLLAYLSDLTGPVMLWDFSDLEEPEPLGRYGSQRSMSQAQRSVTSRVRNAEEFLDLRAPAGRIHDFAIRGDLMYVAVSEGGLDVVDLSDLDTPDTIGSIQLDGRAVRTAIAEDSLYVLTAEEESRERLAYQVHMFDLTNPSEPELVSTIDDIRAVPARQAMETGGGYVFLGLNDAILVLDPGY